MYSMKNIQKVLLMLAPLLLAACGGGSIQDTLGLNREAPDEFTVVSRPPLTVPPEFNLRPPGPGEAPLGVPATTQARELITGRTDESTAEAPISKGGEVLLKRAGAQSVDAAIRMKLTADATAPVDTSKAKTLMDQLTGAEKNEPTVDAQKETERLRANKDAGKPLNEGEVPEEKPGSDSLIDKIF